MLTASNPPALLWRQALLLTLAATLAATLSACCCQGQPVPEDKLDYVGHWTGDGMMLDISSAGYVNYERSRGAGKTSVNGPIQKFTDTEIEVGVGFITTTFKIDKPPKHNKKGWHMTVDGVELSRP